MRCSLCPQVGTRQDGSSSEVCWRMEQQSEGGTWAWSRRETSLQPFPCLRGPVCPLSWGKLCFLLTDSSRVSHALQRVELVLCRVKAAVCWGQGRVESGRYCKVHMVLSGGLGTNAGFSIFLVNLDSLPMRAFTCRSAFLCP